MAGMMIKDPLLGLVCLGTELFFGNQIRHDYSMAYIRTVLNIEMIALIESYVCMEIILFTFKTNKEKRLIFMAKNKINSYQFDFRPVQQTAII